MSVPAVSPPRCHACQAILQPPGHVCARCNAPQAGSPGHAVQQRTQQMMMMQLAQPPKSAGVAVVLSLLWLGAGHIYAGKTGTGVALAILDGLLLLLSITGIGLIISLPVWIIATPIAMVLSASAVKNFNQRRAMAISQ